MSRAGVGYVCAVVLAVVLAAAALAKARDLRGTAASFAQLGVPAPATAARLVPAAEAVIAIALLLRPDLGALAALGSLVFFTTFLIGRLRAGIRAPCNCFGAAYRAPLSAANVVGNGFLILLGFAALMAAEPTRPTALDVGAVAVAIAADVAVCAGVRRAGAAG